MDSSVLKIMEWARTETLPEVPVKVRWKAKFFGKRIIKTYYQEYYERESGRRIPFYLPYLFMQEHFDYLRRYGKIPRHQISMVLQDRSEAPVPEMPAPATLQNILFFR